MLRTVSAVGSAVVGLLVPALFATEARSDDNYGPDVATELRLEADACHDGQPVEMAVTVRDNGTGRLAGTVTIAIDRAGPAAAGGRSRAAGAVYQETVAYDGGTVELTGPVLERPGTYLLSADFTPSTAGYLPSSAARDLLVPRERCRGGVDNVDFGDRDDGLPDTGGPDAAWLLLGLGLVGAGGAAVGYSRRRVEPADEAA